MDYTIINGKATPKADASVSIQDRGFRYGDGVFETIAVHGGAPWRLAWHLARLQRALAAARIDFNIDNLADSYQELLRRNNILEGLLRIQITRGSGGRGYLPDRAAKPTWVIETLPLPKLPEAPVKLWLSSYRRVSPQALPSQYKLCQGMNSTLARMEAEDNGCFEALLLNDNDEICEASSANIFWLKEKILYTPSLACGAVEGSARAAIIERAPLPVKEVRAPMQALAEAEIVFLTNVAWKALPAAMLLPNNVSWNAAAAETFCRALRRDILV